MIVSRHVWRTADGRLVEPGDPDAAFLAWAAGDEVGDLHAERSGLAAFEKARARPADKSRPRGGDKSGRGPTSSKE